MKKKLKHKKIASEQDSKKNLAVIGWKECIAFPEWNIKTIIAKIDSGARSSAIDVEDIQKIDDYTVKFYVVFNRRREHSIQEVTAKISSHARVKSSNGQVQDRYKVTTIMKIGDISKEIELSLVCRKGMLCRVLVGRKSLEGNFLINPERRYLLGKRK